jgi:hypothetical protein
MAGGWRERLRSLRDRFTGKSRDEAVAETSRHAPADARRASPKHAAVPPPVDLPASERRAETVAINLGIDFGTSFTKVCFRDVGTEESCVIPFEKPSPAGALIPTVVAIAGDGQLHLADRVPRDTPVTRIPYLKMRLAGMRLGRDVGAIESVDLNGAGATRALSAWFLAAILKRSQD